MRFVTIVFRHPDGWFQSLGGAFARADDITRVAVHSQQLVADGQAIYLYELEGEAETVRDVLEATDIATSYEVVQSGTSAFAYIHFEPSPIIKRLLGAPERYGLVIDDPIIIQDNGQVEVTLVGEEEDLREALRSTPDELSATITRVGDHTPNPNQLLLNLSHRQREVLKTAYALGYYRQPREATYDDIAAELDCSPTNAGDILRRIENQIVGELLASHNETNPIPVD